MKNLIISVSVLLVLVASTVGIRIYLRGVTEDFLSSVERVADNPEIERDEFARFSSDFEKKKKTLFRRRFFASIQLINEKKNVIIKEYKRR